MSAIQGAPRPSCTARSWRPSQFELAEHPPHADPFNARDYDSAQHACLACRSLEKRARPWPASPRSDCLCRKQILRQRQRHDADGRREYRWKFSVRRARRRPRKILRSTSQLNERPTGFRSCDRHGGPAVKHQQSAGFWPVGAELQFAGFCAPGMFISPDPMFPELGIVDESITPLGPPAIVLPLALFPLSDLASPATGAQAQRPKGSAARRVTVRANSLGNFMNSPYIEIRTAILALVVQKMRRASHQRFSLDSARAAANPAREISNGTVARSIHNPPQGLTCKIKRARLPASAFSRSSGSYQALKNASKSLLITSACVVAMPWGKPG